MKRLILILTIVLASGCRSEDPSASTDSPPRTDGRDWESRHNLTESNTETTEGVQARPANGSKCDWDTMVALSIDGDPVPLNTYKGNVLLIVNVASECGYTSQYRWLQRVYDEYKDRGFMVLAFPSNDYGNMEPGTPEDIRSFCKAHYGVTFPIFSKIHVRPGADQNPIYKALFDATGQKPNWNFSKYLVGRDGTVLKFFEAKIAPDSNEVRTAIESALE